MSNNYNPEVRPSEPVEPWPIHGGCGEKAKAEVLADIQGKLSGLDKTKASTGSIVEALQTIRPLLFGVLAFVSANAVAAVEPAYVPHWQVGGEVMVMTNLQDWVASGGGGGGGGGVDINAFVTATNALWTGKRDKSDLAVYRRIKDIWAWTNWNSPDADRPAPEDFLAVANSPGAMPLYYVGGETNGNWFGANQYWPSGRLRYDQGYGPGGKDATVLNFAFTAYAEDGATPLYRFGATATRESATNETVVSWDESDRNQFVRTATTDLVRHWDEEVISLVEARIGDIEQALKHILGGN